MKVTRQSIVSGNVNTIDLPITEEQMQAYIDGALVQNAFPHLSPTQREFIISGIVGDEWDELFGKEEE